MYTVQPNSQNLTWMMPSGFFFLEGILSQVENFSTTHYTFKWIFIISKNSTLLSKQPNVFSTFGFILDLNYIRYILRCFTFLHSKIKGSQCRYCSSSYQVQTNWDDSQYFIYIVKTSRTNGNSTTHILAV